VTRSAAAPYTAPFAVFLALLILHTVRPLPDFADQAVGLAAMTLVLCLVARPVLDFRVLRWMPTLLVGAGIFVLWIGPDLLFPHYRHSTLFENAVLGTARASLSEGARRDPVVLSMRVVRSVLIVPLVEELFWRGWLMRWLIDADFQRFPLGAYTPASFWAVAVLFAAEHGPYWDVGLAAGVIFNLWMVRTKSLGDLIVAHAVTNACLSAYVVAAGKWEYWL
jgi:CAAX prenyl protease-like protein